MELRSCLYDCRIMHHRLLPVRNRFDYPSYFFLVDLDEIDLLAARFALLGRGRASVFSFREEDHLRYEGLSTKESVLRYCRDEGFTTPIERVALLTNLRTMGRVFNPVSFYFCYGAADAPVCVLAEVSNTFGEMKLYLLQERPSPAGVFTAARTKYFYVSPFVDLDASFEFRIGVPGARLELHIDDREKGTKMLVTSATGVRRTLTGARLAWYAARFPFLSVRILALIHLQALRLWAKGLPYHRKDSNHHLQREIYHAPLH
jgi:DUF1365 family protein